MLNTWVKVAASLLLAACSSSGSPSPLGIPLPDGGSLPVPEACQVATAGETLPLTVTFRVKNVGARPLFYRVDCLPSFEISSCAGGHADRLHDRTILPCACESAPSCPIGGPCFSGALSIPPGGHVELPWYARLWVAQRQGPHDCVVDRPLPPGLYRFWLPLYDNEADTMGGGPAPLTAETEFALPTPGGVVELSVSR